MGKKLDTLFGRNFKTSKFKPLVNLAISRLNVLKNQRQGRCSVARSDTVQLLNLGHHERALLRVEQVIKEQNMLDVLAMIEGYCLLVIERVDLIEQERVCPDELKEAISSLLYASTRCGEFPELQEMRAFFTSHFGKEFVARATELRNNCGVNHKMIQKLSTRQPSLENRLKVLKEIASENGIVMQVEEPSPEKTEEKLEEDHKQNQSKPNPSGSFSGDKLGDDVQMSSDEIEKVEGFSDSLVRKRQYRDVADAAQAAFESAAYAAAAARAAVELSRPDFHDPDDPYTPSPRRKEVPDAHEQMQFNPESGEEKDLRGLEDPSVGLGFEKIHPIDQNFQSESEDDEIHTGSKDEDSKQNENVSEQYENSKQNKNVSEPRRSVSDSSSDPDDSILEETTLFPDIGGQSKKSETNIVFDESDGETESDHGKIQLPRTPDLGSDMKPSLFSKERWSSRKSNASKKEDLAEADGEKLYLPSRKHFFWRSRAGMNVESGSVEPKAHSAEGSRTQNVRPLDVQGQGRPMSVRTRLSHQR